MTDLGNVKRVPSEFSSFHNISHEAVEAINQHADILEHLCKLHSNDILESKCLNPEGVCLPESKCPVCYPKEDICQLI